MLIILLFSLQGITQLCQLFLFCSMNSSNYTSSLSSYYPKQSKSGKKKNPVYVLPQFTILEKEMANPLQDLALGSRMDRGGWRATVHGVEESGTRLSD